MKETPQQYVQRVRGYVEGKQPLVVQAATAKKLGQLIKGVPSSKLRKRPAPDKWSVSEILAHLADAEIVGGFRMRLILGAPGTPVVGFDQDAWVTSGHYDKRDPRKSIEQFRTVREANLALLKSLTPEQWRPSRSPLRAGRRNHRTRHRDVRRSRPQSSPADRANSGPEEVAQGSQLLGRKVRCRTVVEVCGSTWKDRGGRPRPRPQTSV